jgi:hypothetical protein
MSTTVRQREREQQLDQVTAALAGQPGVTVYLLSVAADLSVTRTMSLLDEMLKAGRARCEPNAAGARWWPAETHPETVTEPEENTTGNGTGDTTMTAPKSAAAKARAKYLAAAKRSLNRIAREIPMHQETLAGGGVPASTFAASAAKYFEELAAITALDALEAGGAAPEDDGLAEVSREDLKMLLGVVQGLAPAAAGGGDTPFMRLVHAADGPPWDTAEPAVPEEQ